MTQTKDQTTQVNFRLPMSVKQRAMDKAQSLGTNLNHIMKIFLTTFANDDGVAKVSYDFDFDLLFDQAMAEYAKSKAGIAQAKKLMATLKKKWIVT